MSEGLLRYKLAGQLGNLVSDRQEIVNLVQAHAPTVDVADLPQNNARTMWLHVLVELKNRNDTDAIKELIDEGRRRSKLVDWEHYEKLATRDTDAAPSSAQATTLWSHLGLDVRWEGEQDGRRNVARAASEPQIIEAQVTLQWAGRRPEDPVFEAVVQPVLGRSMRALVASRPIASNIDNVASWFMRFPVAPGRFRSRRVVATVTCDHQKRERVRYLAAQSGYWCTLAMWIALAGFLMIWLAPLGVPVSATGLGLWAVTFGFGWIVPRTQEVWAPWNWVTGVWEATLPMIAVIAALGMVLPALLLPPADPLHSVIGPYEHETTPDVTPISVTKISGTVTFQGARVPGGTISIVGRDCAGEVRDGYFEVPCEALKVPTRAHVRLPEIYTGRVCTHQVMVEQLVDNDLVLLPCDGGQGSGSSSASVPENDHSQENVRRPCRIDGDARPSTWTGSRCPRPIITQNVQLTEDYRRLFPELRSCSDIIEYRCP